MPDKSDFPIPMAEEIEDWEDDVMFGGEPAHSPVSRGGSPMESVVAEEFSGFVPEENPAKIHIQDEGEMRDYVRMRAFIDMFHEIPDRTREVLLEGVENREAYSNSISGRFRKELSEIFRSFGGDGSTPAEEMAGGFASWLKDDLTDDDD